MFHLDNEQTRAAEKSRAQAKAKQAAVSAKFAPQRARLSRLEEKANAAQGSYNEVAERRRHALLDLAKLRDEMAPYDDKRNKAPPELQEHFRYVEGEYQQLDTEFHARTRSITDARQLVTNCREWLKNAEAEFSNQWEANHG